MKTARILLPVLSLLLSAAACGYKPAPPRDAERGTTTFPHEIHGGFDCSDCHTGIIKATRLGEAKLPGVAKCEECHDRSTPADKAKFSPPRREARTYELRFDHVAHLKRVPKGDCTACHKTLPKPGEAWNTAPTMASCLSCHNHQADFSAARCQGCHVSLKRFPLKPISEFAHTRNWVKEHGKSAKGSAESCAACHDQTYCARCHATSTTAVRPEIRFPEQIETDFIHRGDFLSRHALEAGADPASCRKCHGSFFCDSCHTQQSLSGRSLSPRSPHPAGWFEAGTGGEHGRAARSNIVACAACHDQRAQSTCLLCHRSGGANPHPPSFKRTDKAKPMCKACHT